LIRFSLAELVEKLGGELKGDSALVVTGVATLDSAGPDQLGFYTNSRYLEQARASSAGVILVRTGTQLPGKQLWVVPDPSSTLAELLELFHPLPAVEPGVSPTAVVAEDVEIHDTATVGPFAVIETGCTVGESVRIGAGCFVGAGSRIGRESVLNPGVVVYHGTLIGARCIVHSGVVLGGDGFGFATRDGRHYKILQVGRVVLEDEVEIGANTTVDRGAIGDTTVGEGAKIDNLVMIAHGVQVGPASLLAAQAGIAGSTRLGKGVTFAGQAGAAGHIQIGDGTIVAAKSAVFSDSPGGMFLAGVPARDHREWKKTVAIEKKLPEMRAQLRDLKNKVARLEADLNRED
jgi:UDP-3-O-[3-hydroxymyristoyl] glucosamine N-acyltransferase